MMIKVGIDIGTSYSSIAFYNEKTGEAEPIKVDNDVCRRTRTEPYGQDNQ